MALRSVSMREDVREYGAEEEYSSATVRSLAHTSAEKIVALYPGSSRQLTLRVYGPRGRVVAIEEQGFPYDIANLEISPREAKAPYQAEITVTAQANATPGTYLWKLKLIDKVAEQTLGEEPITLVVLPRELPLETAKRVKVLRKVYSKYGIQATLWFALRKLYPEGTSFARIKALYELITGRTVSKGTVGNTLSRMLRKKVIEKLPGGLYKAVEMDFSTLLSRIDLKRVRYPQQVLRPKQVEETRENIHEEQRFNLEELPKAIQRAYERARELAEQYDLLTSLYFLLYTLMGARMTGYLLLWYNAWFIIYEPKTGFCHHYYSWTIHYMLQSLGLKEGIYYSTSSEHEKARRIAQEYIREYYGSHQNARRLHYLLREEGYIWSDDEVYTIRIHHYWDDSIGIEILDASGRELLYSEGLRDELSRVEIRTALPYQHIDEENEETYFSRPAGLY